MTSKKGVFGLLINLFLLALVALALGVGWAVGTGLIG